MNILSQNDSRWKNIKLGSSNLTIGSDGCAITCIAMLAGTTPDKVNAKMPYVQGNLLVWATAASQWGLKVSNPIMSSTPAFYPVIAHVKLSGYDHYIIAFSDGTQYDPWTGTVYKNKYAIIDYRNITKEGSGMEFNEAKDRALAEAFYGTSAWAKKIREDINYIQNTRLGSTGGDNVAVRVAELEKIIKTLQTASTQAVSPENLANLSILSKIINLVRGK